MNRTIAHIISLIILIICPFLFLKGQTHPRIENLPKYDLKPYHFGFSLCSNIMDFSIHPVKDFASGDTLFVMESDPQYGFNIGIISNLRLNDFSDLRFLPTLSFGQRILNYTLREDSILNITTKKIESTYIDFPFILKLKSKRIVNMRAYVLGGAQFSLDLASQAKKKDRNNDLVRLKQNDLLYQVGVGFDFYLEYFKFAIEAKMMYGMRDLIKRDNTVYTNSIDKLNSKIFQLSFLFE